MKKLIEKISKDFETISELESEIEELKNRSLRKPFIFENIKYQLADESSSSETKSDINQISRVLPGTSK